jgi:hypothetical protein
LQILFPNSTNYNASTATDVGFTPKDFIFPEDAATKANLLSIDNLTLTAGPYINDKIGVNWKLIPQLP